MKILFLYTLFALFLFLLNGLLGKLQYGFRDQFFAYGKFSFYPDPEENFAGNFFLKIINPAIYISLVCAMLQHIGCEALCRAAWSILPLYWLIRLIHIAAKNLFLFINWPYELAAALLSLLLGEGIFFLFLLPLLNTDTPIFIPIEELRNAVWFAIIAYLAKVLWDISKTLLDAKRLYPEEKRRRIIQKRYDKFSGKYGGYLLELVDSLFPQTHSLLKGNFICLVYAIMIYEDYNRPCLMRFMERCLKRLFPAREMTLGIMQVKTTVMISDRDSIRLAVEKLLSAFSEETGEAALYRAIENYNGGCDYSFEVQAIYETLLELLSYDAMIDQMSH